MRGVSRCVSQAHPAHIAVLSGGVSSVLCVPRVHVWLSEELLRQLDERLDGRPRSPWVAGVVEAALGDAPAESRSREAPVSVSRPERPSSDQFHRATQNRS